MLAASTYADWIAADWGTSHLRAWAMRDGKPLAEARSDRGMGTLKSEEYEGALLDLIDPWLGIAETPVIACGMVGSRQGWAEAPYATVPCKPLIKRLTQVPTYDRRIDVRIIPGLKQVGPADVMRGEETQIAGHLALNPAFDGTLCLPGTHTKWVQVSAGEVVSFRTVMTGEMFSLLTKSSVLRHSTGPGWAEDAFLDAVSDAMSRPEAVSLRLFRIRAEALLFDLPADAATSQVSGFLIGSELAATRPYWLGQRIAIVGDDVLSGHYASALRAQGAQPEIADGTETTLAGLAAAHDLIKEPSP